MILQILTDCKWAKRIRTSFVSILALMSLASVKNAWKENTIHTETYLYFNGDWTYMDIVHRPAVEILGIITWDVTMQVWNHADLEQIILDVSLGH